MGGSVFLSHASEDKQRIVSLGLIQALQSKGLTVIVDRRESFVGLSAASMEALEDIRLDEMWQLELPKLLLQKADVVLACWSKNYASRFTPNQKDPSVGQYVRVETENARAGEYLVHVILDPVESFPPPYTTLKDRQRLELFTLEGDDVAKEKGYDRLVQLIKNVIEWRRMGSFYEARAWAAIRLLDRSEQEEPLLPHVVQEAAPSLYVLFGPQVEVPEQLYNRFCQFTMPANGEHKGGRPWINIVKDYMSGTLSLKPWEKPPVVHWPQVTNDANASTSSYETALRRIADQLYLAVPRISGSVTDNPLRLVLQSIRTAGEWAGTSYFAYSFISAERWRNEHVTISALIEKLGTELADASVDNFRFLIVIERAKRNGGLLQRLLGTGPGIELGKKEGGPSPTGFEGRPIWYRLPDLTSVQETDFNSWALLLSAAWGLEVEAARQSLVGRFTGKLMTFAKASEELIKVVLPQLWRAGTVASQVNLKIRTTV